jgi:prevent-host-death family protein
MRAIWLCIQMGSASPWPFSMVLSAHTIWKHQLRSDAERIRATSSRIQRTIRESIMTTVTIQEAQAKLPDLIHKLMPGEEVVITENNQPVAKLVSELPRPKPLLRPPPGLGKGYITIISDDDEHLKDFAEYMP